MRRPAQAVGTYRGDQPNGVQPVCAKDHDSLSPLGRRWHKHALGRAWCDQDSSILTRPFRPCGFPERTRAFDPGYNDGDPSGLKPERQKSICSRGDCRSETACLSRRNASRRSSYRRSSPFARRITIHYHRLEGDGTNTPLEGHGTIGTPRF